MAAPWSARASLRLVVATMLNTTPSADPLHLQIAQAWAPTNKHAADLIRRALVLLADHELNASTFTVRCAASTGLNLYDAMIAGLAALKGPKHGGAGVLASRLVRTLVDHDVAPVIRERVALGRNALPASVTASTSAAIHARFPCWRRWRAPARRENHSGIPERIAEATGEFVKHRLCAGGAGAKPAAAAGSELALFAMARTVALDRACERTVAARQADPPAARYVGPAPGRGAVSSGL